MEKKNNGENSGPLTSLPVDRPTATDCNADAHAIMILLEADNEYTVARWMSITTFDISVN